MPRTKPVVNPPAPDLNEKFLADLRLIAQRLGISETSAASLVKISPSSLSDIKAKRRQPTWIAVMRSKDVLGFTWATEALLAMGAERVGEAIINAAQSAAQAAHHNLNGAEEN